MNKVNKIKYDESLPKSGIHYWETYMGAKIKQEKHKLKEKVPIVAYLTGDEQRVGAAGLTP